MRKAARSKPLPQVTIERIPLSKIKPAAYNPRDIGDDELAGLEVSLRTFGLVETLVWNRRTGNLVGGHQRLKVLLKAGEKDAQVSVVDLDPAAEMALNLTLNNRSIQGRWTEDLAELLPRVKADLPAFYTDGLLDDLQSIVKDLAEIGSKTGLSERETSGEPAAGEEEAPAEIPRRTKRGQTWALGSHRLFCGDSRSPEWAALCRSMGPAALLVADPPYGIAVVKSKKGSKRGRNGLDGQAKAGSYRPIEGDQKAFDPAPYLGMAKTTVLFGANHYADKLPPTRGWIVWDKMRGIEQVSSFFSEAELAWSSADRPIKVYRQTWHGMIREGEHDKRVHPTQKPVALYAWILQEFTVEGNAVLDPFAGSGPSVLAAEKLGRVAAAAELDPSYCDLIVARWEKLSGKKASRV